MPRPGDLEHVEVVGAVADRDHRLQGYADLLGEVARRGRLAGPVDDVAEDPAGDHAVDDLELVGAGVVDAEVVREPVGDLAEATRDEREAVAEPAQRAHQRAGSRGQDQLVVHLVEGGARDAGEQGDALPQGRLEVELAAHRALGDPGDLALMPAVGGEELDHLALDQGRVDVHHDQPHRPPEQARRLYGDVHALRRGLEREQGAQPLGVGTRHVQVDRGDRIARHPLDPVDVRAAVGDPAGDGGHGGRTQRGTDDGDVGPTLAPSPGCRRCRGRCRRSCRARSRSPGRTRSGAASRGGR